MERWFVDCHSHVVPSGDDGAASLEDGLELCDLAAQAGTAILFATPHVWPHLTLTDERERRVRQAFELLRARVRLDLRLGFELTPAPPLLGEDPARYVLEGTDIVLAEVPFTGSADGLIGLAEHIEAAGLTPVVAHPERTEAVRERPELARELAERWPVQAERDEPARAPRSGGRGARLGARRIARCGRRRLGRAPPDAARPARRRLRAGEDESGGGRGAAALRRHRARDQASATASISRSRARRLSASVSI